MCHREKHCPPTSHFNLVLPEKQELRGPTVPLLEVSSNPAEKDRSDILNGANQSSWVGDFQGKRAGPKAPGQKTVPCSPYPEGCSILGAQEWAEDKHPSPRQDPIMRTVVRQHLF